MSVRHAKAGGEVSEVNGQRYEGGEFMPVHGDAEKKSKGKGSRVKRVRVPLQGHEWKTYELVELPEDKKAISEIINGDPLRTLQGVEDGDWTLPQMAPQCKTVDQLRDLVSKWSAGVGLVPDDYLENWDEYQTKEEFAFNSANLPVTASDVLKEIGTDDGYDLSGIKSKNPPKKFWKGVRWAEEAMKNDVASDAASRMSKSGEKKLSDAIRHNHVTVDNSQEMIWEIFEQFEAAHGELSGPKESELKDLAESFPQEILDAIEGTILMPKDRTKLDEIVAKFEVEKEKVRPDYFWLGAKSAADRILAYINKPQILSALRMGPEFESKHPRDKDGKWTTGSQTGLESEAKKAGSFEAFRKDFITQLKHGTYWHVTTDAEFEIDPSKGPRDMSSMASGGESPGSLMITSHLEWWDDHYNTDPDTGERKEERKYAALIDMSAVGRSEYRQVSRGMGNEFFVGNPAKARVVSVMSIGDAKEYDEKRHSELPGSENELREFYKMATDDIRMSSLRMSYKEEEHPRDAAGRWAEKEHADYSTNVKNFKDRIANSTDEDLERKYGKELDRKGINKTLDDRVKKSKTVRDERLKNNSPEVRKENLTKWFGDSKVVNDDGSPMTVFHGTDKEFSEFRGGYHYFSENPDFAAKFSFVKNPIRAGKKVTITIDGFSSEFKGTKETISIAIGEGIGREAWQKETKEVPAVGLGVPGLFATESLDYPGKVSITHEKSGLSITTTTDVKKAKAIAKRLGKTGTDWTAAAEDMPKRPSPEWEKIRDALKVGRKAKSKSGSSGIPFDPDRKVSGTVDAVEIDIPGLVITSDDKSFSLTHSHSGHVLATSDKIDNVWDVVDTMKRVRLNWDRPLGKLPTSYATAKKIQNAVGDGLGAEMAAEFGYKSGAKGVGVGSQVMPVHLKIENPLDLRSLGAKKVSPQRLEKFLSETGMKPPENGFFWGGGDLYQALISSSIGTYIRTAAKEAGYDGMVFEDYYDQKTRGSSWVTFDPKQIKSASGGAGKFDSDSPDVRLSSLRMSPAFEADHPRDSDGQWIEKGKAKKEVNPKTKKKKVAKRDGPKRKFKKAKPSKRASKKSGRSRRKTKATASEFSENLKPGTKAVPAKEIKTGMVVLIGSAKHNTSHKVLTDAKLRKSGMGWRVEFSIEDDFMPNKWRSHSVESTEVLAVQVDQNTSLTKASVKDQLLTRASDLYSKAREGDALALAVEDIMNSVMSESEDWGTLNVEDDDAVMKYVEFTADGKGYTADEILGSESPPVKAKPSKMTKHEFGWLLDGYLIEKTANGKEWNVSEDTAGGWMPVDTFSTRKQCIEQIERYREQGGNRMSSLRMGPAFEADHPRNEKGEWVEKGSQIRFEAGKALSESEKEEVLSGMGDVYKDNGLSKDRIVGYSRDGDPVMGYPIAPELFVVSDITGSKIRHYVTLPDGRKAHPSELFPNFTRTDISRAQFEIEHAEKMDARDIENRNKRISDDKNRANYLYSQTRRPLEGSYFAQDEGGQVARVDGTDPKDIRHWEGQGFFAITKPSQGIPSMEEGKTENLKADKMERVGDGAYVGTRVAKSGKRKLIRVSRNGREWTAIASGGFGSNIVAKAPTMKKAIARVVDDYWF